MAYEWLDGYCLAKLGAEKDYKAEWEATRYMVDGKMFLMAGGDKEGRAIYTMKLEPLRGDALRREYPGDVVPGYYMNKEHWNSVYLGGRVPDDVLKGMVDESWALIVKGLPKKRQQEYLG